MKLGDVMNGCTCIQIAVKNQNKMLTIWLNKNDPDRRKHYAFLCVHPFDASDDEVAKSVDEFVALAPEYFASVE